MSRRHISLWDPGSLQRLRKHFNQESVLLGINALAIIEIPIRITLDRETNGAVESAATDFHNTNGNIKNLYNIYYAGTILICQYSAPTFWLQKPSRNGFII